MSTVVSQMEQTTEVIIAKEKDAFPGPGMPKQFLPLTRLIFYLEK